MATGDPCTTSQRRIWLAGLASIVLTAMCIPLALVPNMLGEVPFWFQALTFWVLLYPVVVIGMVVAGISGTVQRRTGAATSALVMFGWALISVAVVLTV